VPIKATYCESFFQACKGAHICIDSSKPGLKSWWDHPTINAAGNCTQASGNCQTIGTLYSAPPLLFFVRRSDLFEFSSYGWLWSTLPRFIFCKAIRDASSQELHSLHFLRSCLENSTCRSEVPYACNQSWSAIPFRIRSCVAQPVSFVRNFLCFTVACPVCITAQSILYVLPPYGARICKASESCPL
jgi:hypothetical protein